MADEKIVEAVGAATATRRGFGMQVERAMADSVRQVQAESEAIWIDPQLSLEEKQAKIAALNHPDAVRARMLKARDAVKAAKRAEEAAAAEKPKG